MSGAYRLYGAETSAFSAKLRSYLRYKQIEHEWRPRTVDTEAELKALARFPTLPVLVHPAGVAVHNANQVIDALEKDLKEPTATPDDPAIHFLALVLADYADSWLAKVVFHYRWTRKRDQRIAAQRVVEQYFPAGAPANRKALEDASIVHMLGELKRIGVEGEIGGALEKSFKRFLKLLTAHLKKHLYLFGGRPSIADFAISAQLNQLLLDPTPAKLVEKEEDGAFILEWCRFFDDPKAGGPFESFTDLAPTLKPLFAEELSTAYLPWAAENIEAWYAHQEKFEATLGRDRVELTPLRSAASSFKDVRKKFLEAQLLPELKAFTDEVGATVYLLRPGRAPANGAAPSARPAEEAAVTPTEAPAAGVDPRPQQADADDAAFDMEASPAPEEPEAANDERVGGVDLLAVPDPAPESGPADGGAEAEPRSGAE